MNEVEFIRKLAGAANGCQPPKLDTADRVLREIRRRQSPTVDVANHIGWLITAATAAAVLLGVLGIQAWQSLNDPLDDMLVLVDLVIS